MMTPAEKRAFGGLLLSFATGAEAVLGTRPIHWYNALTRLGVSVPLFVVHDLGAALLGAVTLFVPRAETSRPGLLPFADSTRQELFSAYQKLLKDLTDTEAAAQIRKATVDDAVIATLLARALSPVSDRWRGPRAFEPIPLVTENFAKAVADIATVWASVDRRIETDYLQHLVRHRLHLLLAIEQIDLDTLELLRLFGREAGALPETELVDLLAVFSSPDTNDVVNFSLEILPSVLETHRGGGQQLFAVDGYSGVVSHGSLDSLVLTEMAYDDELFEQRFIDNEMLYYAHEAQVRPPSRMYQILVDASASMRGARTVFARGLAIALAKRMSLLGFDACVRFFDSRLYEPLRLRRLGRSMSSAPLHIAGVLTFKGEHGRNYARVFSQFASELDRLRERANVTAYVITHAECHVPVDLVRRIRESAELYGVFMLPSRGTLELDYLPLLTQYEVVDDEALRDRSKRAHRAISIVEAASEGVRRDSMAPTHPSPQGRPASRFRG